MPNGFTALDTLNGASTAATSTTGATPVFTTAATTTPGTSASPTTALASQSASSGILRYPLDGATYYLALFILSYVAPSVQSSATANLIQTIGLPEPMKMIDAQSIELNANHRSFVVQMAQQIYSQLAGVAGNTKNPASVFGSVTSAATEAAVSGAEQLGIGWRNFSWWSWWGYRTSDGHSQKSLHDYRSKLSEFQGTQLPLEVFSKHLDLNQIRLRQIINTLKNYSLPSLNSSPYFLNYPAMVLPMYIPNQAQLYEFKFCLINSVTVDWNSAGTAAFFTGTQAPVEVSLALRLIEVGVWFQGDPFLTQGMFAYANRYIIGINHDFII